MGVNYENLENAWVTLPNEKRALCHYPAGTLSNYGTAQLSTDFAGNEIAKGHGFKIETVVDIATGDTGYKMVFDSRGFTRGAWISYPTIFGASAGACIVTLGICTDYTGGVEITPRNQNANFQATYLAQVKFLYETVADPLVLTGEILSDTRILVGSASTNQNTGGGAITGNLPIWLEPGLIYVFSMNNKSGEDVDFYIVEDWFEPPAEE